LDGIKAQIFLAPICPIEIFTGWFAGVSWLITLVGSLEIEIGWLLVVVLPECGMSALMACAEGIVIAEAGSAPRAVKPRATASKADFRKAKLVEGRDTGRLLFSGKWSSAPALLVASRPGGVHGFDRIYKRLSTASSSSSSAGACRRGRNLTLEHSPKTRNRVLAITSRRQPMA
jgi:hypothetical protein